MFKRGDVIDGKYRVEEAAGPKGGMGTIVFVSRPGDTRRLVLKFCHHDDEDTRRRFKREVRLACSFAGNDKVIQILDHNADHYPPYLVMEFYQDGDLSRLTSDERQDTLAMEALFDQVIECVAALHSTSKFHRDIKPHNFLRRGDRIVITDLGLGMELDSATAFTRPSHIGMGTEQYSPPEYYSEGGFSESDARSDIFMIGKTFYNMLTGLNPMFIEQGAIPSPLFYVIARCCEHSKSARYQSLAELRESLRSAFDSVLGRKTGSGAVRHLLDKILSNLRSGKIDRQSIEALVDGLGTLEEIEQHLICYELGREFFSAIAQPSFQSTVQRLLPIYRSMVNQHAHGWAYAEKVAVCMKELFVSSLHETIKAHALEIAIESAIRQHRYAAMDTCQEMIRGVADDALGMRVKPIMLRYPEHFIRSIEPAECRNDHVVAGLRQLRGS